MVSGEKMAEHGRLENKRKPKLGEGKPTEGIVAEFLGPALSISNCARRRKSDRANRAALASRSHQSATACATQRVEENYLGFGHTRRDAANGDQYIDFCVVDHLSFFAAIYWPAAVH
jgi:hypothetical protein